MTQASILVVEDDASVSELVREALEGERYQVSVAKSVFQAEGILRKLKPDLFILDRNLPDRDGKEFCRELRASPQTRGVPVLFLTSKKAVTDKVVGFEAGADDYLTKPFAVPELVARVAALLRRGGAKPEETAVLQFGPIRLDIDGRSVSVEGKPVELTGKEFDLLRAFLERRDRVLTRQFLLTHVWGYEIDNQPSTRSVDWMVMALRKKLGRCGDMIETIKDHGYKLQAPA